MDSVTGKKHIEGRRKASENPIRKKDVHAYDRHQGVNIGITDVLQEEKEQINIYFKNIVGRTITEMHKNLFATPFATALCVCVYSRFY